MQMSVSHAATKPSTQHQMQHSLTKQMLSNYKFKEDIMIVQNGWELLHVHQTFDSKHGDSLGKRREITL